MYTKGPYLHLFFCNQNEILALKLLYSFYEYSLQKSSKNDHDPITFFTQNQSKSRETIFKRLSKKSFKNLNNI